MIAYHLRSGANIGFSHLHCNFVFLPEKKRKDSFTHVTYVYYYINYSSQEANLNVFICRSLTILQLYVLLLIFFLQLCNFFKWLAERKRLLVNVAQY